MVFPVEVKYRQTITPSIINKTIKRMEKMNFKTGIMITENEKRSLIEYLLIGGGL